MHRAAAPKPELQARYDAREQRVKQLTPQAARSLAEQLKANPEDRDTFWILFRYWEKTGDIKDRHALRLWYIEHHPAGKLMPGNIDPAVDRAAYQRGRTLWLANIKRAGAAPETFERAASFLDGGDRRLAEKAL